MNKQDFDKLFDAYIDGLLEGELLERFEAYIEKNPQLQAMVEAHQRIDDSILKSFAPDPGLVERCEASVVATIPTKTSGSRRKLLAACIGLVVIGAASWLYINSLGSGITSNGTGTSAFVKTEPFDLYRQLEATSFEPEYACDNDEEFLEYTLDKFNKPFLVQSAPGLTLTGWTSSRVFSVYTGVLMAKGDDDSDIVVIMDQARFDRQFVEPADDELSIFRREVAGLVFYEITPADEPVILPQVFEPEIPNDPGPE